MLGILPKATQPGEGRRQRPGLQPQPCTHSTLAFPWYPLEPWARLGSQMARPQGAQGGRQAPPGEPCLGRSGNPPPLLNGGPACSSGPGPRAIQPDTVLVGLHRAPWRTGLAAWRPAWRRYSGCPGGAEGCPRRGHGGRGWQLAPVMMQDSRWPGSRWGRRWLPWRGSRAPRPIGTSSRDNAGPQALASWAPEAAWREPEPSRPCIGTGVQSRAVDSGRAWPSASPGSAWAQEGSGDADHRSPPTSPRAESRPLRTARRHVLTRAGQDGSRRPHKLSNLLFVQGLKSK